MKNKTNYYHNKLVALGQKVIRDEYWSMSHLFTFDCGCQRVYCVDVWGRDYETLEPCNKHRDLIDK